MEALRETNKINIKRKVSSAGTFDSTNQSTGKTQWKDVARQCSVNNSGKFIRSLSLTIKMDFEGSK